MNRDPGWRRAIGLLPRALIPGGLTRTVRTGTAPENAANDGPLAPIELLRLIYLSFMIAFATMFIVVLMIAPAGSGSLSVSMAASLLFAVAGASYVAVSLVRERGNQVASAAEALARYRTRMFILVALAEPVALAGFAFAFLTGSLIPYVIGLVLAIPAVYMAAPNRASINLFQERFGGAVDVLGALTTPQRHRR